METKDTDISGDTSRELTLEFSQRLIGHVSNSEMLVPDADE